MGNIPTKVQVIIISIIAIFLFFSGIKYQQIRLNEIEIELVGTIGNPDSGQMVPENNQELAEIKVAVHVVGAVENPAVYTFSAGARVEDAVQAAFPLKEADLSRLNLALPLQDGKQIDVPFKEEQGNKGAAKKEQSLPSQGQDQPAPGFAYVTPADKLGELLPAESAGGKININSAGLTELTNLPRIGPVIAARIVEYRQQEGPFSKTEDLRKVSGIGEVTFEQLKDLITVE